MTGRRRTVPAGNPHPTRHTSVRPCATRPEATVLGRGGQGALMCRRGHVNEHSDCEGNVEVPSKSQTAAAVGSRLPTSGCAAQGRERSLGRRDGSGRPHPLHRRSQGPRYGHGPRVPWHAHRPRRRGVHVRLCAHNGYYSAMRKERTLPLGQILHGVPYMRSLPHTPPPHFPETAEKPQLWEVQGLQRVTLNCVTEICRESRTQMFSPK